MHLSMMRRSSRALTTSAQRLRVVGLGARCLSTLPPHTLLPMPALSPTMTSGNLATWKFKEGDSFSAGDVLAEVETDKATVDYETVDDGFIAKILVQEGYAHACTLPGVVVCTGLCTTHRSAPAAHAGRRTSLSTRPSPSSSRRRRTSQRSRTLSLTPLLVATRLPLPPLRLRLRLRQPPRLRPALPPRLPRRPHRCPRRPRRAPVGRCPPVLWRGSSRRRWASTSQA